MFGKASGACFTVATVLALLAFASAQLNQGREQSSAFLDALTAIFIVASIVFLSLCVFFGLIFVGVWAWGFLHAVEVLPGEWYFRFWPHEQRAQPSGIALRVRESAGPVKVKCHARFGRNEVDFSAEISAGSNGGYWLDFPQQKVDLESDPKEGDVAWLVVKAWPSWWRGGLSWRIQMVKTGVTDHRPAPNAVTSEQVREGGALEENGPQQLIRVTPNQGSSMRPINQGRTVWEIDAYLDVETIDQSRPLRNCRVKLRDLKHHLAYTDKNKDAVIERWDQDPFYQGQTYFFSWSGRPYTVEAVDVHKSERASIAKCVDTRPEWTTTAGAVGHMFHGDQYHLTVEVTADNSLPLTKEYWLQMHQGNRPVIEEWDDSRSTWL